MGFRSGLYGGAIVGLQRIGGFGVLVSRKIVADYNRVKLDLRNQYVADLRGECHPLHGPFDDLGCNKLNVGNTNGLIN